MRKGSGTYPWSFVTQIFHSGQPNHGGDRNLFEMMTSTLPRGAIGSVGVIAAQCLVFCVVFVLVLLLLSF